MDRYICIIVLVAAAISSEALVAPRRTSFYTRTGLQPGPSVATRTATRPVPHGTHYDRTTKKIDRIRPGYSRSRASLLSSAVLSAGDDITDPSVQQHDVNDFQPETMTVSGSFAFFARYVVQNILDKRADKKLGRANRRRLRDRVKRIISLRRKENMGDTTTTTTTSPKTTAANVVVSGEQKFGFKESIRKLNESRKNLIALVGYDSSLLVPAFSFLILGAFMSSVIPHYYSSCISCVAAGEASREKLLWALGGLGISHVLEAVFTGFRGALFWIAGELFVLVSIGVDISSFLCVF